MLRRNELLPSWNDIGNEVMLILKNKDVKKWAIHQGLVFSFIWMVPSGLS